MAKLTPADQKEFIVFLIGAIVIIFCLMALMSNVRITYQGQAAHFQICFDEFRRCWARCHQLTPGERGQCLRSCTNVYTTCKHPLPTGWQRHLTIPPVRPTGFPHQLTITPLQKPPREVTKSPEVVITFPPITPY